MQNLLQELLFGKAETEYNLDQFEEAKLSFKQFLNYV